MRKFFVLFLIFSLFVLSIPAQTKPRARDLGVPFDGVPGPFNAITDVKGVEVGYTTLISGEGKQSVRTGVTAILPQGKTFKGRVFAGWHALNGNGEMTGTTWIEESGGLGSPVLITNTHSVGTVRDAVIEWGLKRKITDGYSGDFSLPVVAETYDGFLNDINGFHVKKEHVFEALDGAKTGAIAEGNVGGGTGMSAHFFKGGTGTASRVVKTKTALSRSASSSRRITARGRISTSRACRSAAKSKAFSRSSIARTKARARSSSSSRPTRRCCRTS
jgi:D-aminopeptidase